jgi:exodeoxyribonuclease V gamma subunit
LNDVRHDGLAIARAGGLLPHGSMGEVLFENETEFLDRFSEKLKPLLPRQKVEPVAFELASEHVRLAGTLTSLSPEGLFVYRVANANAGARIEAWIRHLVLNAFAPRAIGRTSRLVAQDCVLTFASVENARPLLAELLELYWQGMHRPLHFFPRTACAYADAGEVSKSVRTVWEGSRDNPGERDDPYYALAFRGMDPLDDEFKNAAHTMFVRMKTALEETEFA